MSVRVHTPDGSTNHDNASSAFPDNDGHLRVLTDSEHGGSVVAYYAVNHWTSVEITPASDTPA